MKKRGVWELRRVWVYPEAAGVESNSRRGIEGAKIMDTIDHV